MSLPSLRSSFQGKNFRLRHTRKSTGRKGQDRNGTDDFLTFFELFPVFCAAWRQKTKLRTSAWPNSHKITEDFFLSSLSRLILLIGSVACKRVLHGTHLLRFIQNSWTPVRRRHTDFLCTCRGWRCELSGACVQTTCVWPIRLCFVHTSQQRKTSTTCQNHHSEVTIFRPLFIWCSAKPWCKILINFKRLPSPFLTSGQSRLGDHFFSWHTKQITNSGKQLLWIVFQRLWWTVFR